MMKTITLMSRKTKWRWSAAVAFLAAALLSPAIAESVQTMNLRSYLEATLRNHMTQQQHRALARAQALNLRNGQRYYWPQVTVRNEYTEATEDTDATSGVPANRTIQSGVTTGLDTTWTSLFGTEVTLGLEHQYGRQLGKTEQGIPEDELQAQTLSVEISQPLVKHNGLLYNRLPLIRAQTEWMQFRSDDDLNRIALLKEAMLDYISVQEAYDRLKFELEKLDHVQYLAEVTETLEREGSSLSLDGDIARLDVQRQDRAVENARLNYQQSQQELTLSWINQTEIQVQPQSSMALLIDDLLLVFEASKDVTQHPEYQQKQLDQTIAELDKRGSLRDRWPDLEAFFRYEKNYREALADEESQAWGLRFSYALFDLPTREQQARHQAQATIARWETQDQLSQLEWNSTRLQQSAEALLNDVNLQDQSIQLSQRALDYEVARYQEGLVSYSDVRQRYQDRLEQQLDALSTRVELARNLIDLAYYRQWDWLENSIQKQSEG